MRYLKTKDGRVYEIKSGTLKGTDINVKFLCNPREMLVYYEGIEKNAVESENIEFLCDYVFYRDSTKELLFKKLPLPTSIKSLADDLEHGFVSDVKLAIHTEKGFDYIAKMKGILPNGEIDWEIL